MLTLFVAVTVKVNVPAVVGVPDSTPSAERVNPGGRVPVDVHVGVGLPEAVKVEL